MQFKHYALVLISLRILIRLIVNTFWRFVILALVIAWVQVVETTFTLYQIPTIYLL